MHENETFFQVQRKQIDSNKVCSKCPPLARIQTHVCWPLANYVINQHLLLASPHMQQVAYFQSI